MLGQLAGLINIAEKLSLSSPPIDYFYMRPQRQIVPDVVLNKRYHKQGIWLSIVVLHNLSSRVLSSIRIKIPIRTMHDPVITRSDVDDAVDANYEAQAQEVKIPHLDPGEEIIVMIFLHTQELPRFSEPKVIVDGQTLPSRMRRLAFIKKYPKYVLLMSNLYALWICILLFGAYMIFSPTDPKVKAVQEATSSFDAGCTPRAYEKSQVNESLLERHMLGEYFLLKLNQVVTYEDLFKKDYVVICEATKRDN